MGRDILMYNKERVNAFVLALGEVDDLKYAAAAGAINFGFPVIADTVIPEILPTGITPYEHVVSLPWNEIEGANDLERAERLVQKCIETRGVKIKLLNVPVPVPYGSAFEGEVVRKTDMRIEFGGKHSRCFEYLHMAPLEEVVDGKVEVIGPDFSAIEAQGHMDLGVVVKVAGRQMQEDFEPVLERQIHYFVNGASGIQHIGQRDIAWVRISNAAAEKGFNLEHFGKILHARFHADFGAIVDKVQVTVISDPALHAEWLETARGAYDKRNKRLANLTDDVVDTFYSCTLCQSFAPNHVCVVSPERLGLCGAYNWLDCKASNSINPTGPNQPIKLGKPIDTKKGYWEGTNDYAKIGSHGAVEEVAMYSIMENPMTACGCFESIVMLIPEANGVMVVSREDTSMTPAGMTFSTLAGMAGGGLQTPGVMGVGKYYLISPKFIYADGGFKRVVWMSSILKETMADELKAVALREGDPDLIERIADERSVTSVEELLAWLEEHNHPAMMMEAMF
jgi:acetyl-CoA synthase